MFLATPQRTTSHQNSHATAANEKAWAAIARWRLLASESAAAPGFMTLRAVREGSAVVDFVWDFASASAARLLRRPAAQIVGTRLLDESQALESRGAVFEQYLGVVQSSCSEAGNHVHVVNGMEEIHRHAAVRLGDGVAVTLTNLSAVLRAHALRNAMQSNIAHLWPTAFKLQRDDHAA